jgi:hypothetical protein
MDLGSKSYTGKIESGNMLYLKPLKPNVAPSSLLVRTTGERITCTTFATGSTPQDLLGLPPRQPPVSTQTKRVASPNRRRIHPQARQLEN